MNVCAHVVCMHYVHVLVHMSVLCVHLGMHVCVIMATCVSVCYMYKHVYVLCVLCVCICICTHAYIACMCLCACVHMMHARMHWCVLWG